MLRLIAVSLIGLAACAEPRSPALTGRVSVIDGDTLELQGERIRIWGVDAPESRQTCARAGAAYRCGQVSANELDRWIGGRPVTCIQEDTDRYRRIVARCRIDDVDVGGWLVRQGHAVRYPDYAGVAYIVEELSARREGRGVWAGEFDNPWDWRRSQRKRP